MRKVLFKIAFRNVRRQIGNYLIYFVTVSLTVALLFSVNNLILSEFMDELSEEIADFIQPILLAVVGIMAVVIAFVLGYATTFLLRRRKREFGVYLTLGMTRRDVLTIFAGETGITFLVSLGMGIVLGLGTFQVLVAVFMNFLEQPYEFVAYSWSGSLLTVVMVGVMFLVASVASLLYLRFAKISRLLQGESTAPRTVKYPLLWLAVAVLSAVGLAVSVTLFTEWLESPDFFERVDELALYIAIFFLSAGFLPVGLSRSILWLLLRFKGLSGRGAGIFTVRQLSARLNASSLMMGVLSVLLVVAVIAPNIFLTVNATIDADLDQRYVFDIESDRSYFSELSYEGDLEIIGKYAEIEDACIYTIYEQTQYDEDGEFSSSDDYIAVKDVSYLCAMLGYTMPETDGKYVIVDILAFAPDGAADETFSFDESKKGDAISLGGVQYECAGTLYYYNTFLFSSDRLYAVPDAAVGFLRAAAEKDKAERPPDGSYAPPEPLSVNTTAADNLVVDLADGHYDAYAMLEELRSYAQSDPAQYGHTNYSVRERDRMYQLGQIALFLLGDLFVSAVFILMTMAMLALKILSMIAEDRERYRMLWRLGASEGMLGRSLFAQMFFFCFLPFVVPLALCFPLVPILEYTVQGSALALSSGAIAAQVAGFAGVILGLYAVYFLIAYLVARLDIRRTLREIG